MLAVRILHDKSHLQHGRGPDRPHGDAPRRATCSPARSARAARCAATPAWCPTHDRRGRHHRGAQPRRHPGPVHLGQPRDRPAVQGRGARGRSSRSRSWATASAGRRTSRTARCRRPTRSSAQVPGGVRRRHLHERRQDGGGHRAGARALPQRAPGGGGQAHRRVAHARRALDARRRRGRGAHVQRHRHREHARRASRCRRAKGIFNRLARRQARRDRGRAGRRHPGRVRRAGHPARPGADGAGCGVRHGGARPGRLLGRAGADARPLRAADHGDHRPGHRQRGRPRLHQRPSSACRRTTRWRDAEGLVRRVRAPRWRAWRATRPTPWRPWLHERRRDRRRRLRRRRAAPAAPAASRGARQCVATSRSQAGQAGGRGASRSSRALTDARFAARAPGEAARGARRRLPRARARRVVEGRARRCSRPAPALVVDLAADFRVQRPARCYARYYGAHPAPELRAALHATAGRRAGHRRCAARRAIAAPGLLRHRGAAGALPAARAWARRAAGALRGDRLERRRRAAQADDASSRAGAQPLRLLGARSSPRGGGPASVAGWTGRPSARRAADDALGSVRAGDSPDPARDARARRRSARDPARGRRLFRDAYAGRPFVRAARPAAGTDPRRRHQRRADPRRADAPTAARSR